MSDWYGAAREADGRADEEVVAEVRYAADAATPAPQAGTRAGLIVDRLDAISARINRGLGEGLLGAARWREALIEVGAMIDDLINDQDADRG